MTDFLPAGQRLLSLGLYAGRRLVNDDFGGYSEAVGSYQLVVFNRWGIEVFRSEDLGLRWDGRLESGELAPGGLYGYRAVWQPLRDDGKSLEVSSRKVGAVTLIR